jgi:carnitine monooxygenase subunit
MSASSPTLHPPIVTDPDADWSLPSWLYHDAEFYNVEMQRVMRPSWQIVCHESDMADAGSYQTLDFLGENILVIRGEDNVLRAFTNVCRHRASRLLDGQSGCVKKITCPYHAWTYSLDGQLTGVPMKSDYPSLDISHHGLVSVDMELWQGFIFIRLETGGPSVADMMAPYEADIKPYKFSDLLAIGRVTLRPRSVNWKNVGDNYSDGLHIPVAHPGLTRLFGRSYGIDSQSHADKMWGYLVERDSLNLSERMYQKYLPTVAHLPNDRQRLWTYVKLWPNIAFDIYPDQVDFMQFLPVSPTETLIREISYAIPDNRREMRAARYLNWRINRQVNAEDTILISRVQQGMMSRSYTVGPIGSSEVCLRSFARKLRELIPEARLHRAPAPGWSRRMPVKAVP